MSRFYFQWLGNKRQELHRIDAVVDWDQFDVVVEPFAGSAALTLELHARGLGKKHVVNDTDPHLVAMLRFVATNTSQPLFEYCRAHLTSEDFGRIHRSKPTPDDVFTYFYQQRVRGEFARTSRPPDRWPSLVWGAKHVAADACFAEAVICGEDWRGVVDRYKDDPRALIFLDPPYFNSFNQEYYGMDRVKTNHLGRILDGTELFLEMLHYLRTASATIVVITNSCAIIDHIFKPFIRGVYEKNYSRCVMVNGVYVRKSTNHLLLVGGGVPRFTNAELDAFIEDL